MAKVICTRPNAGDLINGVKFFPHPDGAEHGVVSEDISQEIADNFVQIPGYSIIAAQRQVEAPVSPQAPQEPVEQQPAAAQEQQPPQEQQPQTETNTSEPAPTEDGELGELRAKAHALGIKVKGNWKAERLKIEIKAAEDEKIAAAGNQ